MFDSFSTQYYLEHKNINKTKYIYRNCSLFGTWAKSSRCSLYVSLDLTQKPTLMVPALMEGEQTTLTCTAPGRCSGSAPNITWMWREKGQNASHVARNATAYTTENLTAVTQRHSSTLTFNPSVKHHGTEVTCKVTFKGGVTTEETFTLNMSCK